MRLSDSGLQNAKTASGQLGHAPSKHVLNGGDCTVQSLDLLLCCVEGLERQKLVHLSAAVLGPMLQQWIV